MQKNPFVVLGLDSESANQQDVKDAYQRLRARYSEDRFLDGDAGREASEKLDELERAYTDCLNALAEKSTVNDFGTVYGEVEKLLKENKLQEAQEKLDFLTMRDAEWHYLQSAVYYKRGWKEDSKKQLEIALTIDPDNDKYKTALNKLKDNMAGKSNASSGAGNTYDGNGNPRNGGYQRSYSRDPNTGRDFQTACDCCNSLIIMDCCCECLGGDLIRCC